ncbi:MAG: hypothetical protein ABIV50_06540 [Opitutus sp.]
MKNPRAASVRPKVARLEHPLEWLAEPLTGEATFELKAWFGGRTIMLHGRHQLFLTTQGEPWQGVLVCTYREYHESLRREFPSLQAHPVLGKWLYLPETVETFERDARFLVQLAKLRDPRLGILPSPRRQKAARKIRFGDQL